MDDDNLPIFQQGLWEYKSNWIQKSSIFTQKPYEQQIFIFLLSTLKIPGVGGTEGYRGGMNGDVQAMLF